MLTFYVFTLFLYPTYISFKLFNNDDAMTLPLYINNNFKNSEFFDNAVPCLRRNLRLIILKLIYVTKCKHII